MRTEGTVTLADLGGGYEFHQRLLIKFMDIVLPRTTIALTDAPALRPSLSVHAVFLMESAKR